MSKPQSLTPADFELTKDLQREALEDAMVECDIEDEAECSNLVRHAAQVAGETFRRERFGHFEAPGCCVVFQNMGPKQLFMREEFRRLLQQRGMRELGMSVWPVDGQNAAYTWAVLFASDDLRGMVWEDRLVALWNQSYRD